MLPRPTAFDDLPELDPTELLSLEIDIELRDIWEALDTDPWDDLRLAVTASAMRVAYERGRRQGQARARAAGYEAGYEDGYEEGCDSALADAAA